MNTIIYMYLNYSQLSTNGHSRNRIALLILTPFSIPVLPPSQTLSCKQTLSRISGRGHF